jgi:hypothetical protein
MHLYAQNSQLPSERTIQYFTLLEINPHNKPNQAGQGTCPPCPTPERNDRFPVTQYHNSFYFVEDKSLHAVRLFYLHLAGSNSEIASFHSARLT